MQVTHKTEKKWLYLITDFSFGKEKIAEALAAGVDLIQLREKEISSAEYLRRARFLVGMAACCGTKVIINDRADIALLSGADGVHLGQEDIPAEDARMLLGADKIIGVTAKTPEQAREAAKAGADYLGSGAWFPTRTKRTPSRSRRNGTGGSWRRLPSPMWRWEGSLRKTAVFRWPAEPTAWPCRGALCERKI